MVPLCFPLVFTRNSIPGVPMKSFLRDFSLSVRANDCCWQNPWLPVRFGSSTSFKLQQVEKICSNYHSHLFLHAIAFLACLGNPFFATFACSVRANDGVGRILGYRFGSSTSFKL